MAGRNRVSSRGPTIPAQEESQIWTETYNILKQLPDTHAKAQKVAFEANKNQRVLLGLGNGEGLTPAKSDMLIGQKRRQSCWASWRIFIRRE